jgi:hypothetical protein
MSGCQALKRAPDSSFFVAFFLTDLCFDLFVHFLIYHKKQLRFFFFFKKTMIRVKKSLKWETYSQGRTLEEKH